MTTLKATLSEGDKGSPDFGVLAEPPAYAADGLNVASGSTDGPADGDAALPMVPGLVLPAVMPAYADACNALDYTQTVRAEVIYGRLPGPDLPSDEISASPNVPALAPIVMPMHTDTSGSLDFVRIVRAEVVYDKAQEPVPTTNLMPVLPAPAPDPSEIELIPAPAPFVPPIPAIPSSNIAVAAPAPAAAVAFDPMPAPLPFPTPPPVDKLIRPTWRGWVKRAAVVLVGLMIGYTVLVMALIVAYRWIDPPLSTLMLELRLRGEEVDYRPVPLTSISSYLQRAVVTSEDARFCSHHGVDWGALAEAIQDSRGGSTITMQTAKNLFLWPSRSYIRKAIEIPIALTIDFAWPKRRILETYLNIAEWGPGVFGAEAAAQYHFNKTASRLTPHEATLLAAVLPNPIARDAGDPGRVTELLASRLRGRMANSDAYVSCLGLRPTPRAEPATRPKPVPSAAPKAAPNAAPWQTKTTKTEPAKPAAPAFNPWQN